MFGGDKGGYSVTNMSLLMSISDLLVCEGKSAMLLFCMFNVQAGTCSCGARRHGAAAAAAPTSIRLSDYPLVLSEVCIKMFDHKSFFTVFSN